MSEQLDLFTHAARFASKQRPTTPGAAADRAEAAAAIAGAVEGMKAEVLELVAKAGQTGKTDEEVSLQLEMKLDTARARRCELRDAGLVKDSGRRRATKSGRAAVVWIAAELAGDRPGSIDTGGAGGHDPGAHNADGDGVPDVATSDGAGVDAGGKRGSAPAGRAISREMGPGTTPATAAARRRARRCGWCGSERFWRSIFGVLVCESCHPPAAGDLVAEWIDADGSTRPAGAKK